MDAEKTIKKYITKPGTKIVGLVLTLAAVLSLVMAIYSLGSSDGTAAEFYPDDSETGSMAYINVVGISDWLYDYDGIVYYTALDEDGYLYTVRLSDSQFKAMKAQYEYWCDESEDAVAPDAYRLEGYVKEVTSTVRSNIADVWGISTIEYDQYFGAKFLDATTTASEQSAFPWFFAAVMCFVVGFILLLVSGQSSRTAKKCLKRLEERCLTEKAAQQLENMECNTVIGKNKGILSQEFLFGKGSGVVVHYSDILWCYQSDRRVNMIPVDSSLLVGTLATKVVTAVSLRKHDRKGIIAEALATIAQRNPNAMVGYSGEAAKAFSAMRKANK